MRAYVIKFVGKDGRRCSVVFDRYGLNSSIFDLPEDKVLPQATSNAISSVMAQYGTDWIQDYSIVEVA